MKIRKRDGKEVDFDRGKIESAISKANGTVLPEQQLTAEQVQEIAAGIETKCYRNGGVPTAEGVAIRKYFGEKGMHVYDFVYRHPVTGEQITKMHFADSYAAACGSRSVAARMGKRSGKRCGGGIHFAESV